MNGWNGIGKSLGISFRYRESRYFFRYSPIPILPTLVDTIGTPRPQQKAETVEIVSTVRVIGEPSPPLIISTTFWAGPLSPIGKSRPLLVLTPPPQSQPPIFLLLGSGHRPWVEKSSQTGSGNILCLGLGSGQVCWERGVGRLSPSNASR